MILQIAEGGGVTLLPGEEVLVNAQDLRTKQRVILSHVLLNPAVEIPLNRRGPDALPPAQATPVYTVQVLLINHLLEAFACPLERLNARQRLAKRPAAVGATAFA